MLPCAGCVPPMGWCRLCRIADKILLKAKDELLEGDEEQAYVFYMRFIDIYQNISALKMDKKDRVEVQKLLPVAKVRGCPMHAITCTN